MGVYMNELSPPSSSSHTVETKTHTYLFRVLGLDDLLHKSLDLIGPRLEVVELRGWASLGGGFVGVAIAW